MVYFWDPDGIGDRGLPVGYLGCKYLESPGDPNDGIDNDGDGMIDEAQDERPIQALFEGNPELLVQLLRGGHGRWVFSKPKLGSEHIPDFAICEKDSGGYHWCLVELENPNYDALTRSGQPTAKLTHAMQQIHDWRIWLRRNVQYAQNELGSR